MNPAEPRTPRGRMLATLLEELASVGLQSPIQRAEWLASGRDGLIVPRLATPTGGVHYSTLRGETILGELVESLMNDDDLELPPASRSVVDAAVRKAIPDALHYGHFRSRTIDQCAMFVENYVVARSKGPRTRWIHYVPCVLYDDPEPPTAFSIGPVNFVPRAEFVSLGENDSTAPWNYLSQSESDSNAGSSLLGWTTLKSALSGSNWVAWITDESTDYENSREHSLIHVELAIHILQLLFDIDACRIIRHKWDRRPPGLNQRLSQIDGTPHLLKFEEKSPEFSTKSLRGFSTSSLATNKVLLDRASARLNAVVRDDGGVGCPEISERWLTALYWFARGLREPLDFSAIISMGAALDIFAKSSGKITQMTAYCRGLLGVSDATIIFGDMTLKGVVEVVYADGRSQLIHGGRRILKNDHSALRNISEAFLRTVLLKSLDAISAYANARVEKTNMRDSFDDFVQLVVSRAPSI